MATIVNPPNIDYFKPYCENQFLNKPYISEMQRKGYYSLDDCQVERFGKIFDFECFADRTQKESYNSIKRTDELGLENKKEWHMNGDNIVITKECNKIVIFDEMTGKMRPLTKQEKEKLIGLNIKLDNKKSFSKAKEAICNDTEHIKIIKEEMHMFKKKGGKWLIEQYKLGKFFFSAFSDKVTNVTIQNTPRQFELINPKVREAMSNYAQQLLLHLKKL